MDAATAPTALSGASVVVTYLKANAKRARNIGNVCVAATLLIGGSILLLFLYFSQVTTQLRNERELNILKLQSDQRDKNFELLKGTISEQWRGKIEDKVTLANTERITNELLSAFLKNDLESPSKNHSISDEIIFNITSSVIRIGAVLIGIFLIQIMVTFGRYYYKLSEHLSMTAALIELSGGKVADLKVIAPLLLPSKIDFGKAPTSPTEKAFDGAFGVMRELTKKIPTH